jgi:transcriptional regulator with XRE-family HTH domain
MPALAHRIRQSRRAAALTQSQLAEQVGVNRSAVAQWERKDGSRPTSENLGKIAVAANVNFDWLATGRGKVRVPDHPDGETPALLLSHFAHDELEERMLLAFRTMSIRKQIALIEFMEAERT